MTDDIVRLGPQEFLAVCAHLTMENLDVGEQTRIALSRVFGFACAEWDMPAAERGNGLHQAVVELGRVWLGGMYHGADGPSVQATWDQNDAFIRDAFHGGNL